MALAEKVSSASRSITVNIVNRNYPPYPGITGESAAELAAYLVAQGIAVNAIHVDAPYQQIGQAKSPPGTTYLVKTFYNGKHKLLRLFGNLYEAIRLVRKAQSLKADVTIYLTDPPFLSICAALLLPRNAPWILWSMDLFPEGFSASHLVSKRNPLYRLLDAIVRRNPPRHVIALGEHQAGYLAAKFPAEVGFTRLPCGVYEDVTTARTTTVPEWAEVGDRLLLGYCGNLGEAHSTDFLRSVIDNLDPDRHRLVLALYGARAASVLAYAAGKPGVEIVPFVRREELKYIDVHLATLKAEWVDVCVPSKTVSSVCSGSAFLYHGIAESDNWWLLRDAGWIVPAGTDTLDVEVRNWLAGAVSGIDGKRIAARQLAPRLIQQKRAAFESIQLTVRALART